jgi:hypothetical protein
MHMIDVITKLREIAERSPDEIGRAIAAAEKMSGRPVVEAKKPDADGDGVPDWADKKPGKDDNEDKEDDDGEKKGMSDKQAKYFGKKVDEDISITLSGSDAVLAEILKLAGMIGAKTTKGPDMVTAPAAPNPTLGMPTAPPPLPALGAPGGAMGPSLDEPMSSDPLGMDDPMGAEPMMDDMFNASTTPNPTTMGMGAAVPSGNDLSKPKITTPMTSPGNNPMHTAISFD